MPVTQNLLGDGVAEIVLAPGADGTGPALTTAEIRELRSLVLAAHADDRRVTVIRQAGPDFCLGRVPDADEHGEPAVYELLASTTDAWSRVPGITVAAAAGQVQGFGVGFVMQADISVVASATTFRFPEIEAGFAPAIVAAWLARRVQWQTAAPWLLTAMPVAAEVALRHGLVSELAEDPRARAGELVATLTGLDDYSLRECKRFGRAAEDLPRDMWVPTAVDSLVRQHVHAAEKAGAAR
ncbi:Enoyl-CoA hydratase/isomerase [Pseudonocardia dioxanivorans CB1190]|jgi:enoyl-CoA hydratase/carnithine racemase|uniref:Enoyl-CoA hydratase/isomerase n=1 Tax=Pseudonocardia dioxanivorans (strain ATCC 55486 / DSM 44775 / JCM 13855 / CB1190) TaxID=675635 RepID=F4CTQ0_PSEUX|nr:enoyl-CoA hydratase/isomerase family protein [Pseudonocardia dioxanivorans]AEA28553.1 Enoyl-CoA hydratase/isomerase [Pseudonocardia dioxanivorans CB1190]